jgi:hypothetical protein
MNYQVIVPDPNQQLRLYFAINEGEAYFLIRKSEIIIGWSRLGLTLNAMDHDPLVYHQTTSTRQGITNTDGKDFDPLQGFTGPYNEMEIGLLTSSQGFQYAIQFRVSDHGIAFRYRIPAEENKHFIENSRFVLHTNLENWQMIKPDDPDSAITIGEKVGEFKLPVDFQADDTIIVTISEWPVKDDHNNFQLIELDEHTYQIQNSQFITTGKAIYSPWRIIRIEDKKNGQKE